MVDKSFSSPQNLIMLTADLSMLLLLLAFTTVSSFAPRPNHSTHSTRLQMTNKYHFAIDRGGTFTDIHCLLPSGDEIVSKLLSVDPTNYDDAPTEGIRRILHQYEGDYPRGK